MLSEFDRTLDRIVAALTAEGGQFEMTSAKVRGHETKLFKAAPPTLREYFAAFFAQQANKEFIVHGEERLSFGEVYRRAQGIAAALQHQGIAKGDRVAIAMRNYPEWIVSYVGILHFGAIAVPMNAWWKSDELAYGLKDSAARLVIADEQRLGRLAGIPGYDLPTIAVRTGATVAARHGARTLEDVLADAPKPVWYLPPLAPEDDATIMYTSGSTGDPKGAVATHRSVVHGALSYLVQGLAMLKLSEEAGQEIAPQQIMLLNVPLFHITAAVPILMVSIAIGRKLVMMHKWDAGEALKLIEAERATYFVGVPTMSHELMQHPDRDKYDLGSLTDIAAGGAPRPPEHVERLASAFKARPALGYGLTETNGVGAGNLRDSYRAKPASTGRASKPMVEIAILAEDGATLPPHETGEVAVRSPANARGYWNRPEATAAAFTDGWFRTGDVGYLDEDGYLFIVDRKKDIIIRGGENISCVEVESALYTHPAVAEASVFGLPDDRLGEIVGAMVYLKLGETAAPEALIDCARDQLAAFKVPAKLWISKEPLPKLGSAKIDKMTLRALARERFAAAVAAE